VTARAKTPTKHSMLHYGVLVQKEPAKQSCPTTRQASVWGRGSIAPLGTNEGEWSASRPGRALAQVPIVQEAGWAPRVGLDTEVRGKILLPLKGIEPGSPDRPTRSQTLYSLSYPAHKREPDAHK
jgi:hypothetical protein